ncbi:hypothetical protein K1T71_008120 [Dendrolimus kikuchii]|uniref:Uncharacterized protein n=1 Tax=Dendrolimus kikuchii TaxID=765133 RepID=A0ACC1CWH3_9NEOP|nr:hypothetical protein K1T71_008120 [Dendrolimus kikuchii]
MINIHSRGLRILALVPKEHAPSDASDQSESECELHDDSTHYSSSPPSIGSLENLNIYGPDSDDEPALSDPFSLSVTANKLGDGLDDLQNNERSAILDSVPLTPILQEIQESNYQNVPSTLSAIPSLPSTPAANTKPRKTRSKYLILPPPKRKKRAKKLQLAFKWKKTAFRHRAIIEEESEDREFIDLPETDASPLTYFHTFFTQDIKTDIVEQSNFYSVQETGKSILLTENEFNDFLAIHIIMGIVEMPSYIDYWSQNFKYAKEAEIMPLKRYQQIRRYLHFADNNLEDGDRYYKVRPLLEKVRLNCLKLQGMENKFSIDEMIIAYKGSKAGKRKQYMKDKPNKWGFKNYVRAGVSGIIYDFVMYGGEDTFRYHTFSEEESSLGFGAQVVIALCQSIQRKPAIIYCDNFFSSPELFYILRENYGFFSLGTIRNNRLRGVEKILPPEKEVKKKERGFFVEAACNETSLAVVRWNDNKVVTFISSFVASVPVEKIQRYSKDVKKKVDVQCPQIVRQYNKHMGGVDLADMLISLYKIPFKSRRWYLGIFAQLIDICLNNAWLVYRNQNNADKKSKMSLKVFRYKVYESLLMENRCAKRQKTAAPRVSKPQAARPSSPSDGARGVRRMRKAVPSKSKCLSLVLLCETAHCQSAHRLSYYNCHF